MQHAHISAGKKHWHFTFWGLQKKSQMTVQMTSWWCQLATVCYADHTCIFFSHRLFCTNSLCCHAARPISWCMLPSIEDHWWEGDHQDTLSFGTDKLEWIYIFSRFGVDHTVVSAIKFFCIASSPHRACMLKFVNARQNGSLIISDHFLSSCQ